MLDFSTFIDLPLLWALIIATAVFLYVLLDGFDLGCGILFPFAPSDKCRNRMMNSIAPFWDGNETWLVLGGGGLLAAFPLAYSVIMPALYLPVIFMLLGLVFRGVAFEFRFKTTGRDRKLWDISFHAGSLLAAFMQGVILGTIVQGVEVEGRQFAGDALYWASGFSMMTGLAVVFGYALLGATWLVMKTEDKTQKWARKAAIYVLGFVAFFMAAVSISMPFVDPRVFTVWFTAPNIYYLAPIPALTLAGFLLLFFDLRAKAEVRPFFTAIGLFFLGFLGLCISLYPWMVPYVFTIHEAAAANTSLSLMLIGVAIFLPLILAYTAYSFYVFRGKSSHESGY